MLCEFLVFPPLLSSPLMTNYDILDDCEYGDIDGITYVSEIGSNRSKWHLLSLNELLNIK